MHLPDGFLNTPTALLSAGAAIAGVSVALREVRNLEPRRVPMLGLGAAFVFAAQMLNFPVVGGTSGHVIGGVLAAILLGPAAAVVVLTCVLIVQCFLFADGGVLALGANVFNMAIVNACGGFIVFQVVRRLVRGDEKRLVVLASIFAAWCGTVLSSVSCAGQLALSRTAPWGIAFPAMANIHMAIGIAEGIATGLVVLAVLKARPDLVFGLEPGAVQRRKVGLYAGLITVGMAVFVAPFASPLPDGLETVAQRLGFHGLQTTTTVPLPDYQVPFIGSAVVATGVAALVGVVIVFGLAYVLARVLVPNLRRAE